jgi:hypothetical protein
MNAQQSQEDARWLKIRELQMQDEAKKQREAEDKSFLAQFPKVPKKDPSTPKIVIKSSNPQSYLVRTSNMTLEQKSDEIQRMMREKKRMEEQEKKDLLADMKRLSIKYKNSGGRKMRKTRKGAKKNKKYTIKMNNRKMNKKYSLKKKTYKRR